MRQPEFIEAHVMTELRPRCKAGDGIEPTSTAYETVLEPPPVQPARYVSLWSDSNRRMAAYETAVLGHFTTEQGVLLIYASYQKCSRADSRTRTCGVDHAEIKPHP